MEKNKKRALVTGGAGFIGSHLSKKLLEKGYKLRIFDNLSRNAIKYTDLLNNQNIEFIQGDILNNELLLKSMNGCDLVIHLAAIAGVSNYYKYPARTLKTNLIGTYNILESMLSNGIKRLIDMSTSEVFGPEAIEVTENSYFNIGPPNDKRWSYASSKIGGEQLIYRYSEEFDLNSTVVRPFNIYGPRQIGEGAISNFCKCIINNKKISIEGSGIALRSWCYIDDFIEALLLIIENPHAGVDNFNIGNPWTACSTYSLAEFVLNEANKLGLKQNYEKPDFVPMNFTEIRVRYPNIDKFRIKYNWIPKINLETGIFNTLKWFKENYEKD